MGTLLCPGSQVCFRILNSREEEEEEEEEERMKSHRAFREFREREDL